MTEKYFSVHETECFHFCVSEYGLRSIKMFRGKDESELSYARRKKLLKKIGKENSRFAFDSEDEALKHLKFLKAKQLNHLKRDIQFIECFLGANELIKADDLYKVPNTKELVGKHYVFD